MNQYAEPIQITPESHFDFFDPHHKLTIVKRIEKAEYEIVKYWRRTAYFYFRYQVVDSSNNKVISYDEIQMEKSSSKFEKKKSLPVLSSVVQSLRLCLPMWGHRFDPWSEKEDSAGHGDAVLN